MIRFETSRNGKLTAVADGTYLHSRYDPVREAERYVRQTLGENGAGIVVIVGECLGYLHDAVRRLYPRCRAIAFYLSDSCRGRCVAPAATADAAWYPGTGIDAGLFLSRRIAESDIAQTILMSWQPGAAAFPDLFRTVSQRVAQTLREMGGSLSAARAFGRRWIANAFANSLFLDEYLTVGESVAVPIVIAASGPSLAEGIPLLQQIRDRISLWALPSSLEALLHHGLSPDLTVSTDPGFWASVHLRPLRRFSLALAAPLTGCREEFRSAGPFLLIDQGTFPERLIIDTLRLPAIACPENGTVAGSALQMALSVGTGPVILAGLDLCFRDLRSHVEPHPFQPFLSGISSRLTPEHSVRFERAFVQAPERNGNGTRTSAALRTYAGWFDRLPPSATARVFRYGSSPVRIPGIRGIDEAQLKRIAAGGPVSGTTGLPYGNGAPHAWPRASSPFSFRERRSRLLRILRSWLGAFEKTGTPSGSAGPHVDSDSAIGELLPFLVPDAQSMDRARCEEEGAAFLSALAAKVSTA